MLSPSFADEGMAEDMARALMGSRHEPQAGEPTGMAGIRQQILDVSRELATHRQQCDVLWTKLLGLRIGIANPQGISTSGTRDSVGSPAQDGIRTSAWESVSIKREDHGADNGVANGNLLRAGSCGPYATTSPDTRESIIGCDSQACHRGQAAAEHIEMGILDTWDCLEEGSCGESA